MEAVAAPLPWIDPEKVAYWYFRLNGYLSIENFVVHPSRSGSQRTDADLLGVRFPFRAERLFDDPADIMKDDQVALGFDDRTDVIIVEVKTNQPCTLNGPWTNQDRENIERVLAALGCVPQAHVRSIAKRIYATGAARIPRLQIRLVAVGRECNDELAVQFQEVTQLTWGNMLEFIWCRFDEFSRQKTQVDQWDSHGRQLKELAEYNSKADFVTLALKAMGVAHA